MVINLLLATIHREIEEELESMSEYFNAWEWVKSNDELSAQMEEGEVFSGFREGAITFPPSFRWKPFARAGDYCQVSIYQGLRYRCLAS